MPPQKITRALPLNQPVTITVNTEGGEVAFACGMNMFKARLSQSESMARPLFIAVHRYI